MSSLVIRDLETGEVVKRIDTSDMPERQIASLERGMSINLDWERFTIEEEK